MPPLTRTDTRASIFSWWSDNNSLLRYGPTINLHVAAKPLIKLMYHLQAKEFIRKNRYRQLSTEMVEIYMSYFPWDFVSWSTKLAILQVLSYEIYSSKDVVQAAVDSPGFPYIWEMLGSPDPVAQQHSCRLLFILAQHEYTIPHILEMRGCERLVALLEALCALSEIACWLKGAQAIVDAKVQDHILELLKSQSEAVTNRTCWLMEELAGHKPIVLAILDLNLLKQLVVLARKYWSAIDALYAISQWPDGVTALADLDVSELQHMNFDGSDLPKFLNNIAQYKAGKPDSAHEGVDL